MEPSSLKYLGAFFIAVATQGFFFTLAQLSSKNRNAPRIFLALIVLCFSICLLESGLWWTERMDRFVHLVDISASLPFLFGPLVYFYFKSSLQPYIFKKEDLLHALPFILHFSYCASFYFSSTADKEAMMRGEIPFTDFFPVYIPSLYTHILKALSLLSYALFTWHKLYHKTKVLSEVRNWFRLTFGVFAFYVLNFIAFHTLKFAGIVDGCSDYGIASAMSVFVLLFSWFGFVRPKVFDGYSVNEALQPVIFQKYKSSALTEDLVQELGIRLEELMRSQKLFKDERLRLDSLAKLLDVSRNSVSQVINRTGMNFFEYVNSWRIEEAKKLLSETSKEELNIIEVAYEVGFNNKVSFNKSFKKSTGLTPTEFRRLALEKKA
ncbi:MAG: helix-turn-helix transcriptional regulator [Bacteroidia bacterium]|nr:helix-turn-helix transcriptional regulator [Bacteroidia bacterium]